VINLEHRQLGAENGHFAPLRLTAEFDPQGLYSRSRAGTTPLSSHIAIDHFRGPAEGIRTPASAAARLSDASGHFFRPTVILIGAARSHARLVPSIDLHSCRTLQRAAMGVKLANGSNPSQVSGWESRRMVRAAFALLN